MGEMRTESRVNHGRSPAAIVLIGLLGLAGLVWMLWPKPPRVEQGALSEAGSRWVVEPGRAVLAGSTMGTSFSVVLSTEGKLDVDDLVGLQGAIDAELIAVNRQMSTYLADSELSRFNRDPGPEPFAVSRELVELVALAKQVSADSEGAFDVTVGPLVDAWGFGAESDGERRELDAVEITALRGVVGDAKLRVDRAARTLAKQVPGLRVDLSAIAKGHGCDRVGAVVEAAGWTDYMVEIGGEVWARGDNPDGEAWKLGVERPSGDAAGDRVVQAIVRVRDAGVATSGDYRNYWERDGVRYSHTVDPRTGRPITHTLASVTVIHPESAALADAWATALSVLGPEQGPALAERLGLAAYFLIRVGEGYEARATPAFAGYAR
jgi:FAD:protein FMN transferase